MPPRPAVIDVDEIKPKLDYEDRRGDDVFTMEREHVEALLDGRALRFYPRGVVVVVDDVWFDDVERDDSLLDEIADAASRLEELEERMDADDMNRTRDEIANIRIDLVDEAVDRLVDWNSSGRGTS